VDLDIVQGETLGLVGESGCGKSTLGRAIIQLVPATAGSVLFDGIELIGRDRNAMRPIRQRLQIIFQDPYASLNPRMPVGAAIAEPMRAHLHCQGQALNERVDHLLAMVGLDPRYRSRYPYQFSGGQRQRIGIARALALDPEFLVADEPISALDVSVQAQVLNLLKDLQSRLGLTYLFIAHDIAAVRHLGDRIAVMYLGKIVEIGAAEQICHSPHHPYTKALIDAVPIADPAAERARPRRSLRGETPKPLRRPGGCAFARRCPIALAKCRDAEPPLENGVACWKPLA
jgi:oligopeptide/dipeptide ABC transporter ATP-binding protein